MVITHPNHEARHFTCSLARLREFPSFKIFPDNKGHKESCFPKEGLSITRKPQGHMVIAYQHMEKWILSGSCCKTVDLGAFTEHWKGFSIRLVSD